MTLIPAAQTQTHAAERIISLVQGDATKTNKTGETTKKW